MTSPRPNILLFCTDQQRFDTVRALGNPHIRPRGSPSLVRDGVAFTSADCLSPSCSVDEDPGERDAQEC